MAFDIPAHLPKKLTIMGFWGVSACSNAAPHHPFWHDTAWQQAVNGRIRAAEE